MDVTEYETLQEEYERNDYKNSLVSALNAVSGNERDLIITYIANNFQASKTAHFLQQPRHKVNERLMMARQHIIQEYADILKQNDDTDYLIDYFRRKHTKPKRPVVRVELYELTPIARYESIEEAAEDVNGNASMIISCCNKRMSKYKNSRWLWETDFEKIKETARKKTHR